VSGSRIGDGLEGCIDNIGDAELLAAICAH
jgi:hypothetical protein